MSDRSTFGPLIFASSLFLLLWLLMTYSGLFSAAEIWYENEIFNHGFLILPGALYFAYLKRGAWMTQPLQSSLLPSVLLVAGISLYAVGAAGDIQLFMHAATFGLLPVLVWMLLGLKATLALLFPLAFIVFAIPVGEQLIPWLQEITADMAVYLLKLTGIPLYRSGLYIEIPQGRFLVAEACSGISFFIASMVVGSVYAFLNFSNRKKQFGFFALSVVYPIFANAVRVYGIILIAYWTDMEYAAGADHLIYGWFFFAFVLITLLGLGELLRDKNVKWDVPLSSDFEPAVTVSKPVIGVGVALMLAGIAWINWIGAQKTNSANLPAQFIQAPSQFKLVTDPRILRYKPDLKKESDVMMHFRENGGQRLIYQAWFNGTTGELVSGLHRLYSEKSWSQVEQGALGIPSFPQLNYRLISDPLGNKRLVATWYVVDGRVFVSDTPAKLYQTGQALLGKGLAGLRVIVSVPADTSDAKFDKSLVEMRNLVDSLLESGSK